MGAIRFTAKTLGLLIAFQTFVLCSPHILWLFPFYKAVKFFKPDYETAIIEGYKRPVIGLTLCRKCTILRYWPASRLMQHHNNLESLKASASNRCWLCKNVYAQMLGLQGDVENPPVQDLPSEKRRDSHRLLLWFAWRTRTEIEFLKHIRGKNYHEVVYNRWPRALHQDLSSPESFSLVQEWLKRCDEQHKCYQGQEARLPTTVIDVTQEDPYLLVFKDSSRPSLPYITLSHCWGGEQPITTTLATIDQRRTKIPLSSLPALYRDAITVTRKLGINYLWIDSLCIIQDSKDDWSREAASMGDIYRLSYLTIFTLSSRNCHERILIQRPAATDHSNDTRKILSPARGKEEIFRTAPLCQRAWAVQERLLSSRILYYSDEEMFWECLACTARESSFRVKPYIRYLPYQYDSYECTQVKIPLVLPLDENPCFPVSPPSDWHPIVAEYTRCRLTLPSDKLPALSGLASVFRRNTGYHYLAGLWQEDFANGLLWYVPQNASGPSMPRDLYRGPSWSWVSTDLAVKNKTFASNVERQTNSRGDIKIVDSDIRLASPDPTGEVLHAAVTVQTSFYKLFYKRNLEGRECQIFDTGEIRLGKGILDYDDQKDDDEAEALKQCAGVYITQKRVDIFKNPMYIT